MNLGKGAALKTAFNHCLLSDGILGVVTADADGQHHVSDILKVARELDVNPSSLILGYREFSNAIPFRSKFGNQLTKVVFSALTGVRIRDTQTGLRGIPVSLLKSFIKIRSNRYEFELDMLVLCGKNKITINEIPIQTIYEDSNASSHFNPIFDSLKIYFVFVRFVSSSIFAFLVDTIFFSIFYYLTSQILNSIIFARLISGAVNFILVKHGVFYSKGKLLPELGGYVALACALIIVSYLMIQFLVANGMSAYLAKILSESILFMVSFSVQRALIFRGGFKDEVQF